MVGTILDRNFFSRPTVEVARGLLGQWLVFGEKAARITETEAYLPAGDAAAHAAAGRTRRTEALFGQPGHAYIYLNYGLHWLLNVVAEPEGVPGCVLLRGAGDWRGPGRLTRGLGIGPDLNGTDLTRGPLILCRGEAPCPDSIQVTRRVGIRKSPELPLRFFIAQLASLGYNRISYGRSRKIEGADGNAGRD